MTFTRRPPPAEDGGWPRRLKGCEVLPCTAPVGGRRGVVAVRPESAGPGPSHLHLAPSGRGGMASPPARAGEGGESPAWRRR